jgi:hypothetical protein
MMSTRLRRLLRLAAGVLLLAAGGYLVALRLGYLPARPGVLAALVGVVSALLVALLALSTRAASRGPGRLAATCEGLTAAGLLVALGAGLANWAFGFQGAVLVMEREPVQLSSRTDLAGLDAGPLADPRELDVVLGLARLQLQGVGPGGFRAVSSLKVLEAGGDERGISVASDRSAASGKLVFHQGMFGFAPRVVVTRAGGKLLDEHVPFRTVREGEDGMAFVEDFEIAAEKLLFHGAVSLEDLNEDMKGHPRLELAVERDGAPVGRGTLRPGEFVELQGGVRVGFAGLQRWSEILFSRRNYTVLVLAGSALAALAGLAWAVVAWRGR